MDSDSHLHEYHVSTLLRQAIPSARKRASIRIKGVGVFALYHGPVPDTTSHTAISSSY